MTSTFFWVAVVVIAIVAVWLMSNNKNLGDVVSAINNSVKSRPEAPVTQVTVPVPEQLPAEPKVTPPIIINSPFIRRHATLTVEHNEALLGSLFSRELESLPDGISREEFERAVTAYQHQHLKEAEIKIPRSLNFNYEKYAAEQEAMRRNVSATASQFVQRGDVGGISEKLAKGAPQTLAPRAFLKKSVAKRR